MSFVQEACAAIRVAVGFAGLQLCVFWQAVEAFASGPNGCALSVRALNRRRVPVGTPARAPRNPPLPREQLYARGSDTRAGEAFDSSFELCVHSLTCSFARKLGTRPCASHDYDYACRPSLRRDDARPTDVQRLDLPVSVL